jgi:hypothetical protein
MSGTAPNLVAMSQFLIRARPGLHLAGRRLGHSRDIGETRHHECRHGRPMVLTFQLSFQDHGIQGPYFVHVEDGILQTG